MRCPTLPEGWFESSCHSESHSQTATHRPQSRTKTCSINLAPTPYLARVLSGVFVCQTPRTNGRCFQAFNIPSIQRVPCPPKYKFLFSSGKRSKPGPKGPSAEIIAAVVEFKQRNPRCGCPRIAQQLSIIFGIDLHPDVVRRILVKHFKSKPGSNGPSWLTFIGHSKDSLWSMDFFKAASILLKSYSVMVVMDQFSRRIIGFAVLWGQFNHPMAF